MNSQVVEVTIQVEIENEAVFRQAAFKRACTQDAESPQDFLDHALTGLDACACMIIDPGLSPAGATILGSYAVVKAPQTLPQQIVPAGMCDVVDAPAPLVNALHSDENRRQAQLNELVAQWENEVGETDENRTFPDWLQDKHPDVGPIHHDMDKGWLFVDLVAGLSIPDEAKAGGGVLNAAAEAVARHKYLLDIEGDHEIQVWHLLASLHEYCAVYAVDLYEQMADVRRHIESGEIPSPEWIKWKQIHTARTDA